MNLARLAGESDKAYIARLQKATEELAAKVAVKTKISFKVSEKGGLSVYGLGRFPVTLYKEQWQRLNESMPALVEFIGKNEGTLKSKE